jgi:hypothetical protein
MHIVYFVVARKAFLNYLKIILDKSKKYFEILDWEIGKSGCTRYFNLNSQFPNSKISHYF